MHNTLPNDKDLFFNYLFEKIDINKDKESFFILKKFIKKHFKDIQSSNKIIHRFFTTIIEMTSVIQDLEHIVKHKDYLISLKGFLKEEELILFKNFILNEKIKHNLTTF